MDQVNIHNAKTNLSRYLERVEKGETIVICRHNKPIAELRPVSVTQPRTFGQWAGKFTIPPDFDEPLDEETLALFSGERD
jgi:prevent-host-death family protein